MDSAKLDQVENAILTLVALNGQEIVAAAAIRTLPVISFAESNAGITKYKDAVMDAKAEMEVLNRLIANLEGEIRRQAQEIKTLEARAR